MPNSSCHTDSTGTMSDNTLSIDSLSIDDITDYITKRVQRSPGAANAMAAFDWLVEFRKNATILLWPGQSLEAVYDLVAACLRANGRPRILRFRRGSTDSPAGDDDSGLDPNAHADALVQCYKEFATRKKLDVVVLGAAATDYDTLSEVRLAMDRNGVILQDYESAREQERDARVVVDKFARDKKIDAIDLTGRCQAVFVSSWSVRLSFPDEPASPAPTRLNLALAAIVKNEAHCIATMIRSVGPIISYGCILDTGSTDDTIDVARTTLMQEGVDARIESKPFAGFGASRNACLDMVPASIQWVIMLDADEVVRPNDFGRLAALLAQDEYDAWALPRTNWMNGKYEQSLSYPDRQFRLFRNRPDLRFEGSVHERLRGYRKLGCPPANVSFSGQVGGPHIHHLNTFYKTRQELDAKQQWYKAIDDRKP